MNNFDRYRDSMNVFAIGQPRYETNGSFQPVWANRSNVEANDNTCNWRTENRSKECSSTNWRSDMKCNSYNKSLSTTSTTSNYPNQCKINQPRKPKIRNRKKHDDEIDYDEFVMLTANGKIDYDYLYTGVASAGSYEVRRCDLPKELL